MRLPHEREIKIAGLIGTGITNPGGCEIYRITQPLHYLGKRKGFKTVWLNVEKMGLVDADIYVLARICASEEELPAIHNSASFQAMVRAGIVRPDTRTPVPDVIRAWKHKAVFEVDDDFTNRYREVHNGGPNMLETMAACDAMTVSTHYLKKLMEHETGVPAYVCKNYVSIAAFKDGEVERRMPGLSIGITGSPTHMEDWRVLETVIPRILAEFPETFLLIGGFHPDYLPEEGARVKYIDFMPYPIYTASMRAMDIILCPVDPDDRFNDGKSPIKAIEGNAAYRLIDGKPAGAAVIATRNPVYREWIVDGLNGLLVDHTPEAWYQAIRTLITDQALRKRLSYSGYQYACKHGDIETGWKDWARAYRAIARGELP